MKKWVLTKLKIGSRSLGFRKRIHQWRLVECDEGAYVFFDPRKEKILLFDLTLVERLSMLEKYVSVSASKAKANVDSSQLSFPKGVPYECS